MFLLCLHIWVSSDHLCRNCNLTSSLLNGNGLVYALMGDVSNEKMLSWTVGARRHLAFNRKPICNANVHCLPQVLTSVLPMESELQFHSQGNAH